MVSVGVADGFEPSFYIGCDVAPVAAAAAAAASGSGGDSSC